MEQFSLEKYLANPSRRVVTRNGYPVRIICTDAKSYKPIVALITNPNGDEFVGNYDSLGDYDKYDYSSYYYDGSLDLFFAPEKHEGWVSIYRRFMGMDYYIDGIFDSEEKAKERGGSIATVKIEWEE